MTFGLLYAFSENFVLPLSHDEVVHGKGSLLGKMPGDRWQQFANLRAYFGFMWTHPGKKLLFMGGEFAQADEWNHDRSLDWHLLDDAPHAAMQDLVRDLNRLYRDAAGAARAGLRAGRLRLDRRRRRRQQRLRLRPLRRRRATRRCWWSATSRPVVRHGYRIGVPRAGRWAERLNTDAGVYGGSNVGNPGGRRGRAGRVARPAAVGDDAPAAAGDGGVRASG